MKQKYLLTVKTGLLTLVVGLFGSLGVLAAPSQAEAISASTTIPVEVTVQSPNVTFEVFKPSVSQNVSRTIPVEVSGKNISTVDVYIDRNNDGIYTSDEKIGQLNVDESGIFGPKAVGSIALPSNTPYGNVGLGFVAHSKDGASEEITVARTVVLNPDAPVIAQITPDLGPIEGGTTIIIDGSNFENVETVLIGDQKCLDIVVISPKQISCVTPPGVVGVVDITVVTDYGSPVKKDGFLYFAPSPIPLVPGTGGIFRLGNSAFRVYDIIMVAAVFLLLGSVIFLLIVSGKKHSKPKTRKSSAKTKKIASVRSKAASKSKKRK